MRGKSGPPLLAAHVHHGLQAAADAWAEHCAGLCAALGVPFKLLRVQVEAAAAEGPEAAAREARYAALRALMQKNDLLVTAHQRDDQAETVLLRLLRGAGVEGLAAMRPLSPFPPGQLWRPLLDVSRGQLQAYARSRRLKWIEDPHNADPRYARSWLRGQLMPQVLERYPQAQDSLARAARLSAEAAGLLEDLARIDLPAVQAGAALSVRALLALEAPRRHNLLRHWLRQRGFEVPPADTLDRLDAEVLAAAPDAEPLLAWAGCELRRYRDALHAMAPLPPPPDPVRTLEWTAARLELPAGCGSLRLARSPRRILRVRFARGGERLRLAGGAHTRTLKNLFQEAAVPPWVRLRTPLVELEGELAYVAGIGGSEAWSKALGRSAKLEWSGGPPG